MNFNLYLLRLIKKEYKHIRFKSTIEKEKTRIYAPNELRRMRTETLAGSLKCNSLTARKIVSKNQTILSLDDYDFIRNINFCEKHLKLSEIVEYPLILSMNSNLLQHRYFSLKELGCEHISACNILRFPFILRKTPETLQKEGLLISSHNNALAYYLDDSDRAEIIPQLHKMYEDGSSLKEIKETMNAEFLVAKLGCSIGKAHQMFKSYPPLRVHSISNTDKILNLFLSKIGLTTCKIFKNLSLLSLHPESVQEFVTRVPTVLGISTELIIQKQPRIIRKPIEAIQEVESVLKYFDISDQQLSACPKIMAFAPCTLKERLSFLCDSKDFSHLKPYTKFLWLVYYFNNINSRLQELREMNLSPSVSKFIVSKSCFERYLCVKENKSCVRDVRYYLANLFQLNELEISELLKEYPNHRNLSLLNCQKVIAFLLDAGVTKKQILKGIGIVFYDFSTVEAFFKDMQNHPECQPFNEWMMHYNLIQLLIYTIEVSAGFDGSRLFRVHKKMEEEELLLNCSYN